MPEFKYVAGKEGIQELWRRIRAEIGKFNSFQTAEAAQDGTPNIALEDRKTNIIYLVEEAGATPPDLYKEWIWTLPEGSEGEWVCIGDTSMDLSDMAKKSEMSVETVQGDPTKKTIQLKTNLAQEVVIAHQDISGKQDVISDLGAIRTGAAAGATAYQKPNTGIPSSDMTATVQASLGKADSAVQPAAIDGKLVPSATGTAGRVLTTDGAGSYAWYNDTIEPFTYYEPIDGVTIGGRKYKIVQIGDQWWLAENLDFKFTGCSIGQSGYSSADPMANYYNDDETTYGIDGTRKCGLLYNWPAVKYLNDNRSTLIPGWHVPSTSEWDTLATAVGGKSSAGTKLKASNVSWSPSWGGTDDYGFCVLPAGCREDGYFLYIGGNSTYWTISEVTGNPSTDAYEYYFNTGTGMDTSFDSKAYQFSVRLVKDSV